MSQLIKAGETFRVFNGDATGTVKSVIPSGGLSGMEDTVVYVFDHDLEKTYSTDARHFNSFTYPHVKPAPRNRFPHPAMA